MTTRRTLVHFGSPEGTAYPQPEEETDERD